MSGRLEGSACVARNVSEFYAAFLGRQLTREELRTLTEEYIRYHASDGTSREAIREASVEFGARKKPLLREKAGPTAYAMRHWAIHWRMLASAITSRSFMSRRERRSTTRLGRYALGLALRPLGLAVAPERFGLRGVRQAALRAPPRFAQHAAPEDVRPQLRALRVHHPARFG